MANAIGERRIKDLNDILVVIETNHGWPTIVDYLLQAKDAKYMIPIGFDYPSVEVEPLKFREVIFEVLGASGLEPIPIPTNELLLATRNADSGIDAMRLFLDIAMNSAKDQCARGNTLFFEPSSLLTSNLTELAVILEDSQEHAVSSVQILKHDNTLNIEDLWYTDPGRIALSDLGITGTDVTPEVFGMVLSVLQVSYSTKEKLRILKDSPAAHSFFDKPDMSKDYENLLGYLITQNTEGLRSLGSKHSSTVMTHLLRKATDEYNANRSSESYRSFLSSVSLTSCPNILSNKTSTIYCNLVFILSVYTSSIVDLVLCCQPNIKPGKHCFYTIPEI